MAGSSVASRVVLASAFSYVLRHYWLDVFPRARAQMRHWRRRASRISDLELRSIALEAQRSKSGNLECAAVFAVCAPRRSRGSLTDALVAFQATYDYIDLLAEQPSTDPIANGHQLHQALLAIVDPDQRPQDYYARGRHRHDGGYLQELIDACGGGLWQLPSFSPVRSGLREHVGRMVSFQSFNHGDRDGSHDAFVHWAKSETPPDGPLRWWEMAAAAGSSLPVLALMAAASEPNLSRRSGVAIEDAYFPWIAALNTLLDSLVDQREDSTPRQNMLLSHYRGSAHAAECICAIAERATLGVRGLPHGSRHAVILAAMIAFYLSDPEAQSPTARAAAQLITSAMGDLAGPAMLVFRVRNLAARAGRRRLRTSPQPEPESRRNAPRVRVLRMADAVRLGALSSFHSRPGRRGSGRVRPRLDRPESSHRPPEDASAHRPSRRR